jgi:hypothetical protein
MTMKANYTYRDHGSEIGSLSLHVADISVGGADYDALITKMEALESEILAITLCTSAGHGFTQIIAGDSDAVPVSAFAQREIGLRVFLVDDVNGRKSHFTIPGPDLADLVIFAGTDLVDLEDAGVMSDLVTTVEASALSADGNAVTVLRAVIVGRRN